MSRRGGRVLVALELVAAGVAPLTSVSPRPLGGRRFAGAIGVRDLGLATAVSLQSGQDSGRDLGGLVAAELDAARAALPPGPGAVALSRWGAAALRRACSPALAGTREDPAAHPADVVLAAFGRLDPADAHRAPEALT